MGDLRRDGIDDHLRDGTPGRCRGTAHYPDRIPCPDPLRLRIAYPWNAFPHRALAESELAQQPRRAVTAPGAMERTACDERANEHSLAMDQGPQRASSPDPRRCSRISGCTYTMVQPAKGRMILSRRVALSPCGRSNKLQETTR